jgi:hypothetical protein
MGQSVRVPGGAWTDPDIECDDVCAVARDDAVVRELTHAVLPKAKIAMSTAPLKRNHTEVRIARYSSSDPSSAFSGKLSYRSRAALVVPVAVVF